MDWAEYVCALGDELVHILLSIQLTMAYAEYLIIIRPANSMELLQG